MHSRYTALVIAGALFTSACAEPTVPLPAISRSGGIALSSSDTYVIVSQGGGLPTGLAADVAAAGGSLTAAAEQVGVAIATSSDPSFLARASKIKGVNVAADVVLQFNDPNQTVVEASADAADVDDAAHQVGGHETFRAVQWAPDAISAPAAWAAGAQGAGARVAVLDGGFYDAHPDLAGLDVARSASFVPGQPYNFDTGTFWHGTHVAGIVGGRANNFLTVGMAPQATLIGVKVLHNGSGAFSWIIQGIIYAATPVAEGGAGAHIINMSLGAGFNKGGPGAAHLLNALGKASSYAHQRGVTIIAAAGNDGEDLDHTSNLVFVPAMSPHVIAVAATGPMGWAVPGNPFNFSLDRPASYTNFGQSAINLAGPGGDFALPGTALCSKPRLPSGTVTNQCWVFDMVMSSCRGSLTAPPGFFSACWAAGTSMASPAVAGVAALIVGKFGPMHPAQLEARLRASADDLGKPGNDDFYGRGRVNAYRAIQ
jgi:subtilisin family serine protease